MYGPRKWWIVCLLGMVTAALSAPVGAVESPRGSGEGVEAEHRADGWPRRFELDDGTRLTLYQPQFERWVDFKALRGTAAVGYERSPGDGEPLLGTIIFDADSEIEASAERVRVHGITLLEGAYTGLSVRDSKILTSRLVGLFPRQLVMCLDQVLAGIRRGIDFEDEIAPEGKPPRILVRQAPAIVLRFEGEPRFEPAGSKSVEYAANSDRLLFHLPKKRTYYLQGEGFWLRSSSLDGPWEPEADLPKALRKVEAGDRWPNWSPGQDTAMPDAVPEVVAVSEPTELVVIDGEPELESIPEIDLQWVSNTEGDLFFRPSDRKFYLLAATGHWMLSDSLAGRWSPAAEDLPSGLISLPPDHEKASVLARVPGTPAAREAAMRARVPRPDGESSSGEGFALGEFELVGENTLYAGQDSQVYRRDGADWLELAEGRWQLFSPPEAPQRDASGGKRETWGPDSLKRAARRRVYNLLEWDYRSRLRGQARCAARGRPKYDDE